VTGGTAHGNAREGRIAAIEVEFPDLRPWADGNTGIPYVWRFESPRPGPRVTIQALTHGNAVCGAICNDWLLREGVRPVRGTLTITFANVDSFLSFDATDPYASRCLDEDFNRLWTAEVLDGPRQSRDLARARALRPLYDDTDYLLDLHSMTDPCPPLALSGRQRKGLELAQAIAVPAHVVIDAGHAAGKRLRDYGAFDDPVDERNALLIECGQHWERSSPHVAKQATLRFLRHFGMLDPAFYDAHVDPASIPPDPSRRASPFRSGPRRSPRTRAGLGISSPASTVGSRSMSCTGAATRCGLMSPGAQITSGTRACSSKTVVPW
jgi:predicted deacylase